MKQAQTDVSILDKPRPDALIQSPCHMQWKDLNKIKNSKNRHCVECKIDIVDFSQMSNEQILTYLSKNKDKKVCCRMRTINKQTNNMIQQEVLHWHEKVINNEGNRIFRSFMLGLIGLVMFAVGCQNEDEIGEPACIEEYVPDTTTEDPNDSTYVCL